MRIRVPEGCIQKKVASARFSFEFHKAETIEAIRLGDITNKNNNTKKLTSSSLLFLCAMHCASI